jgi:hypothetical protein
MPRLARRVALRHVGCRYVQNMPGTLCIPISAHLMIERVGLDQKATEISIIPLAPIASNRRRPATRDMGTSPA